MQPNPRERLNPRPKSPAHLLDVYDSPLTPADSWFLDYADPQHNSPRRNRSHASVNYAKSKPAVYVLSDVDHTSSYKSQ